MAYNPEQYQANKAEHAAKNKAWREANPEQAKNNRRRYYEENKEKEIQYSTNYNRLRKIGITPEQYNTLLQKQNGVCAICKQTCSRALAADHCHTTGKVRGLLCNNCNRGLGHFKDSRELLETASAYLNTVDECANPWLTDYNEIMNKDRE